MMSSGTAESERSVTPRVLGRAAQPGVDGDLGAAIRS